MSEPVGDTWCTPEHLVQRVRTFLGGIDCDPASNDEANKVIQATTYFTIETDGLANEVHGTCLCNPPYGKKHNHSQAGVFLDHLIHQYNVGNMTEGLFLSNVATDTEWFERMWQFPLLFFRKRLQFYRPGHPGTSPRYANVMAYIGHRPYEFEAAFKHYGHVDQPRKAA